MPRCLPLFLLPLLLYLLGGPHASARDYRISAPGRPHMALDMAQQVAGEAYRRLGHSLSILPMPLERGLVEANIGAIDGDLMRTSPGLTDYPGLIAVPTPLAEDDFVAYGRGQLIRLTDADSLRPYRLGTVRGIKELDALAQQGHQILYATDGDQAFRQLDAGRVDLVLLTRGSACRPAQLGLQGIRMQPGSLGRVSFYHHLHKQHDELARQVDATLRQMRRDGSLQSLQEAVRLKWLHCN